MFKLFQKKKNRRDWFMYEFATLCLQRYKKYDNVENL